ncbi:hypothetical protein PR048_023945 [Dryococelus australis]|uniref:Uncharacterized protein n=1 Tax=Dryococelus australis TaxID=614101 RepID=A0ABQ9GVK6_9NEOP|nr:hypothetical protein PR048_023945 [Dryococelus australis]
MESKRSGFHSWRYEWRVLARERTRVWLGIVCVGSCRGGDGTGRSVEKIPVRSSTVVDRGGGRLCDREKGLAAHIFEVVAEQRVDCKYWRFNTGCLLNVDDTIIFHTAITPARDQTRLQPRLRDRPLIFNPDFLASNKFPRENDKLRTCSKIPPMRYNMEKQKLPFNQGGGGGGVVDEIARGHAFRQDEPGSNPGGAISVSSHVGIVPDDAAGLRVLSVSWEQQILPTLEPRCCIHDPSRDQSIYTIFKIFENVKKRSSSESSLVGVSLAGRRHVVKIESLMVEGDGGGGARGQRTRTSELPPNIRRARPTFAGQKSRQLDVRRGESNTSLSITKDMTYHTAHAVENSISRLSRGRGRVWTDDGVGGVLLEYLVTGFLDERVCLTAGSGKTRWKTGSSSPHNTGSVGVYVRTHLRPIGPYHTDHCPVLDSVHYYPFINQWRSEMILTQ